MAYRRFKLPEWAPTPATLATSATVPATEPSNVATLAKVAGPESKTRPHPVSQSVASVATVAAHLDDCAHWDQEDWRAYYNERAAIAEFDGGASRKDAEARAFACCVSEWLNQHPVYSSPSSCLECGGASTSAHPLIPFGADSLGHAWLHARCWDSWYAQRKREAADAIAALGIGGAR